MKHAILAALLCFAAFTSHAQTLQWTYKLLPPASQGGGIDQVRADASGAAAFLLYTYNISGGSIVSYRFVWIARNGKVRISEEMPAQVSWSIIRATPTAVILANVDRKTIRRYGLRDARVVVTEFTVGPDQELLFGNDPSGFADLIDPNGFFVFKNTIGQEEIRRYRN